MFRQTANEMLQFLKTIHGDKLGSDWLFAFKDEETAKILIDFDAELIQTRTKDEQRQVLEKTKKKYQEVYSGYLLSYGAKAVARAVQANQHKSPAIKG